MNKRRLNPARIIYSTMQWSKASMPVLALAAAIASAIRTVQAIAEIYTASGSLPFFVMVAAFCIAFGVEGAIYLLALAQEAQQIKWRTARRKRHVTTLATIVRGIAVRLGLKPALTYDQLPENDGGVGVILTIAFLVAIITNLYLGLKPLLDQVHSSSLQTFISNMLNAPAELQLRFILDLTIALFPPFMERVAGHMAARFAGEVAGSVNRQNEKIEHPKTEKVNTQSNAIEQVAKKPQKGAAEKVIEYLNEHPEARTQISQNQLAKQLGVSVGTVNAVFNRMYSVEKEVEHSSNGKH